MMIVGDKVVGVKIQLIRKFSIIWIWLMDEQNSNNSKEVKTMTQFAEMRFSPDSVYTEQLNKANSTLVTKLRRIISWPPSTEHSEDALTDSQVAPQEPTHPPPAHAGLMYSRKLTEEHILIGNENQLDLLLISNVVGSFLDTEFLWSLNNHQSIDLLFVDRKKSLIFLGNKTNKNISVFRYNPKKIYHRPKKIENIILETIPEGISIIKDTLLILGRRKMTTFTIMEEEFIKSEEIAYMFPAPGEYSLYKIPQPMQTTLNIFFAQQKPHCSTFCLWMVEVDYVKNKIKMKMGEKIYDIKTGLYHKIKIRNSSMKGNFIMNLGSEILIFKKGYILDSVKINISSENFNLKYVSDNTLVHFNHENFEIYDYYLDTKAKPEKIIITPKDSMFIHVPHNAIFFDALPVFNNNVLVILEVKPKNNKKVRGELNYWLGVTRPVSLNDKMSEIFPLRRISCLTEEDLNARIEVARKMGLSQKQIYLELWKRSKKQETNLNLLIKTEDYESIQTQIMKMLRKTSMSFVQLYKIHKNSFEMLSNFLFSPKCTKQIFFGYISASYLIKKLEYYRSTVALKRNSEAPNQPLMVSIKKYNEIKEIHLINHVVKLAEDICLEKKEKEINLRLFLSMFAFELRIVYEELLQKLIKSLGFNFLILLEKFPELLPYEYPESQKESEDPIYSGIWRHFSKLQRKDILSIQNISTIDNREVIMEGMKNLWFKRANFFGHCFITEPLSKIDKVFEELNSEQLFYHMIQLIIDNVNVSQYRRKIFSFIEEKYENKLNHLKNRINLYNLVYYYLESRDILPVNSEIKEPYSFKQFLALKDYMVFQHLFETEKIRKGLILEEIKPIFQDNSRGSQNLFNEFLLNYFNSPVSQVSDIKYIFNRINNENREFHMNNQSMYNVLIDAIAIKFKIGSVDDIPLDEILIYIENIPINKDNEYALNKLMVISAINRNKEIMIEAHVDMSVQEIIDQQEQLMIRVINHELYKSDMYNQSDAEKQLEISYTILANLEFLHNEIYKIIKETETTTLNTFYIFFIYLVRLAQKKSMVSHIRSLINNSHLASDFSFDESICESLVIYLYKVKLHEQPEYSKNVDYLRNLLNLLKEDNEIREYIVCEFEIAMMLSSRVYKVSYPLSYVHTSVGMIELEEYLKNLTPEEVLAINIDEFAALVLEMQNLNVRICEALNFIDGDDRSELYSSVFYRSGASQISRKQIYEIFMMRLLRSKKLIELIPIYTRYFENSEELVESDIVYLIMYLLEMDGDLNPENKFLFFRLVCFYYNSPLKLFHIVNKYITTPMSTREQSKFLRQAVQKCQQQNLISYSLENKILHPQVLHKAMSTGLSLDSILLNTFNHLKNSRNEFYQFQYFMMFAVLIHSPYILTKILLCSNKTDIIREIRIYLTYLLKEKIFNPYVVLQLGYRVFMMALYTLKDEMELEEIKHRFIEYSLDEDLPSDFEPAFNNDISYFKVLEDSYKSFKREKNNYLREKKETEFSEKQLSFLFSNPEEIMNCEKSMLSEREELDPQEIKKNLVIKAKLQNKFNESEELKKILVQNMKSNRNNPREGILRLESDDKNGIEEDSPIQIRIFPETNGEGESQEGSLEEIKMIKEASNENESNILEGEMGHLKEMAQLKEVKVKDIIKKSSLFSKDEVPQSQDPDFEKFEQKLKEKEEEKKIEQMKKQPHRDLFQTQSPANTYFEDASANPLLEAKSIKSGGRELRSERSLETENGEALKKARSQDMKSQKKKCQSKLKYLKIEGFPEVEEVGKQLYQNNLIIFENIKNQKFKLDVLKKYENMERLEEFLKEIIRYIYYESNDSSLLGVINLIEMICMMYNVPYNPKGLEIWRKSEKLYRRYDSGKNPRQIMLIEAVFKESSKPKEIYKFLENRLLEEIDDSNVYKFAKMIGMIFASDEVETQILYNYLIILSQRYIEPRSPEVKDEHEKISIVVKKIPLSMLISRFLEYYNRADVSKKEEIMSLVVEKVKKLGNLEEKIELLEKVVEFDPSQEGFLERLRRSKGK